MRVAEEHGKTKAQQMFGAPLSPMNMGLNHHMNMGSQMNMGGGGGSQMNMMNSMGGGYPMPPGGPHHSGAMHRGRSRFGKNSGPY